MSFSVQTCRGRWQGPGFVPEVVLAHKPLAPRLADVSADGADHGVEVVLVALATVGDGPEFGVTPAQDLVLVASGQKV